MTQVNEATLLLGTRPENYITVPVTILTDLNRIIVDGTVLEFRKGRAIAAGVQALMRCRASHVRYGKQWTFVEDKDGRRIFRSTKQGLTTVEWV